MDGEGMSGSPAGRYRRQTLFPEIGEDGQQRLASATVVVLGCGATGSMVAALLARAGVGRLRLIDRDFVEISNLHRQVLFDEDDLNAALPKAHAAANKLRRANSEIIVEPVVTDLNAGNILQLVGDATVVVDGSDNFAARYLLNDACVAMGKPWVYTGVVASWGMSATMIPDGAVAALPGVRHATGCLRCLLGDMPAPGTTPTCDTAGVTGPAVSLISSVAAAEALKMIVGRGVLNAGLLYMDLWTHEYEFLGAMVRDPECPVCARLKFDYLEARVGAVSSTLCGRNAVQVALSGGPGVDLARLEQQLSAIGSRVQRNEFLLRATIGNHLFTIFPDNRAIIQGTDDEDLAKSLYARYVGV